MTNDQPLGLWKQSRVAEFLDISERSVSRLAAAGDLTRVYLGSSARYDVEEVIEYKKLLLAKSA